VLTPKGLLYNSQKRGQQFLEIGEIGKGNILIIGGVPNLLTEKLFHWFSHAKRVMEQEKKYIRIKI
jgi:hypothetical protein